MAAKGPLNAREFGLPSLPPGAPSHLEHLLDELSESLELDAPGTSLRVIKETFSYLTGFFADLIEEVASVFGEIELDYDGGSYAADSARTIREGIEFLRTGAPEGLPEVRALVNTFYEGSSVRKFARILELGGSPRRGVMPLAKFVQAKAPGRKRSIREVKTYFPYLREWLDATAQLFNQTGLLMERTTREGRQAITLALGNQRLELAKRLSVSNCPLCIPEREILVPEALYERPLYFFVPQKAPKFLTSILDRLAEAMEKEDAVAGCHQLGNALEFLIRYFAGVTYAVCEDLGITPEGITAFADNSESIAASESLLNECLDALQRKPDSLAAKTVVGVFYRRNEFFEFVPRWHTEQLALSGQVSAWCQLEPGYGEMEDPEVCKIEFEKQVETLREWLTAMGSYLQTTEHFFEEVQDNGSVEFSLRIADGFVEVGEPGYLLWLNNPRPVGEVEVETGTASRPLIREPIQVPTSAPEVLKRILTRMDIYLRLGEPIEACTSLRDAVDYLTRYFAGLAVAAFKRSGTLPAEAERMAQSSMSVHECEKLLLLALRSLGMEGDEEVGRAVRNVFYFTEELSEKERPTGAHSRLLAADADPNSKALYIAEFCSLKAGEGVLSHPARSKRELERFLPPLQDWLAMAEPLFKQCNHYEEPPKEDGKTELVIEFNDIYLELVAPDYIFYIRPGADEVPDIEAPELPPIEEAQEQDLVDQPTRRPQDAGERPFIVHRVDLIGQRENSRGVTCEAGYIVLTNAGGGTLSGMAVSTDPIALEVEPKRFRGNKVQLSYWVDTEELPDTHEVFIEIKTAHEVRSISVYEMIGQARAKPVSTGAAMTRMVASLIMWLGTFVGVFWAVCQKLDAHLTSELGAIYTNIRLMRDSPESLYDVVGYTHLVGYWYLFVGGMVPVAIGRIFKKLPPSTQELLQRRRRLFMITPSLIVAVSLVTPIFENHFTTDPDFPYMHLDDLFLYFIGLNLCSTFYQELSLMEKFDDWLIDRELRKWVPPIIGWFIFITTIFLGVSSS